MGDRGDLTRAVSLLTDGLTRFEALGDLRSIAIAQALLGGALQLLGELEQATESLAASLAGHAHLGDPWFVSYCLMDLAQVQVARGRWEEAARLLGAAEAIGAGVSSQISSTTYEAVGAAIRAHLDTAQFTAAWETGQALTLEQAVATALAIAAPAAPQPGDLAPIPPDAVSLTKREREVARLLAQGKSDREIAAALFVSVSTVGVHVHHILQKLDLHSRHQVADWLAAQGPDARDPT